MSIVASKDKDGVVNVVMCGKISRNPELRENTKGSKVKFSIAYGKKKYMDCDAWADSEEGEIAGRLEVGDKVLVMGTHRTWEYNEKTYQSVSVDGIFPMGVLPVQQPSIRPTKEETAVAGTWEDLDDGDISDSDLPF